MSYLHFRIPYLDLKNYTTNADIVKIIPEEMARYYQVVAIDKFEGQNSLKGFKILTIGMVNPKDETAKKIIEGKTGYHIEVFQVNIQDWANTINKAYLKEVV